MEYTIEAFVDRLLLEKGVSGLELGVMAQLKSNLIDRADDMINAEILANMPKDSLPDFEKKLDEGNNEAIQEFCREQIENLDEVVAGALVKLQNTYLTATEA